MRSSSRPTVAVVALAFVLIASPRIRSGVEAQQPSKAEAVSVLRPARVFDGRRMHGGWAVRVRGDRIDAAGPAALDRRRRRARSIDLPGTTLIPGLVEGHSHVLLHPYDETSWNDQVLHEASALRVARATNHLRATLMAGFTTIRDLGHGRRRLCRRRAEAGGRAGHHSGAPHAGQHPRHRRDGQLRAEGLRARVARAAGRRGSRRRHARFASSATRSGTAPTGSRSTPTTDGAPAARRRRPSRSRS